MAIVNDVLEFLYKIQMRKAWYNGECEVFNPELKVTEVMTLISRLSNEPLNKEVEDRQAKIKKCPYCENFHKGGMVCLQCGTYPPAT